MSGLGSLPQKETWTAEDIPRIKEKGAKYKKVGTIYAIDVEPCNVMTRAGITTLNEPGWVATDGESVWPMTDDFFDENYSPVNAGVTLAQGVIQVDEEDLTHIDDLLIDAHSEGLLDRPGLMHLRNKIARSLKLDEHDYGTITQHVER